MKNSEYWKQRFTQMEEAQNKKGEDAVLEIQKQYRQAQKELEGKINTWYQRFADNNNITLAEARKMLSSSDLKELKWDIKDYIKYGEEHALTGRWEKELENASARFHISKYEALKIQTQQSLEVLFAKQFGIVSQTMESVYKDGFFHTAYEIQNGLGIGWDIAGIDQSQVEKVILKPWAVDGKNFSERIWGNKEKLISEVHTELTQNILLGADPQKAIDNIAKKMNVSKQNAGRLVMTEEAYFSSAAQRDCFLEFGVEEYEIVATLDSHTSEICRTLDGQHFPMKDYQAGVTAPPFHVYCRSTTVPYFEDDYGVVGERAARDKDGNIYYIPADMNYQEWKEIFVDGGDKPGLQKKFTDEKIDFKNKNLTKQKSANSKQISVHQIIINGKKQGTSLDMEAAVRANPNYSQGGQYMMNCQRCVQTYEFRRRGFDVEALPKPTNSNIIIWGNECFVDSNGNIPQFMFNQTVEKVQDELANAPDGARYIIYVAWKKRDAHVFIAEKVNGVVRYVDPQSGNLDVSYYFGLGKKDEFGFLRIDDKELTKDINIINATMK